MHDGRIDPNRMFSSEGATKNLRLLNPKWSEAQIPNGAVKRCQSDRHKFLKSNFGPRRVAASSRCNNNSNGYSVESEVAISDKTSLKDAKNPHEDSFLATDPRDYEKTGDVTV